MAVAVVTDVQIVLAGANWDLQPPIGEDYKITAMGSSVWVGVPPNQVPELDIGLFDGALGPSHILRSTDIRGWFRRQNIVISNANYLRINNPGAGNANVSMSVERLREFGPGGADIVRSDIQQLAGAATWSAQPPVGENWAFYDFGSTAWVGAAPAGLPNLQVDLTDGVDLCTLLQGTERRLWDAELTLYANNANYLDITNSAGVQADICFIAELIRDFGAGPGIVTSDVQQCVGAASVDFQPPAGHEWLVTAFGAATWIGVSPNMYPDCTVHIFDGVNASMIASQTNALLQTHDVRIAITNGNYLRMTDTSGVAQDLGISAKVTQEYL